MKKIVCFAFALLLVFSAFPAKADIATIRSSNNALWGAVGTSLLNYKEYIPPPSLTDSERGWTPSLAGGISSMSGSDLYLALEGNVAWGDVHYNGAQYDKSTNVQTPYQGSTRETISNISGKIGKGLPLGSSLMLTPYLELGYRYWDRNLTNPVEDYQDFNALAGLMLQISPSSRLVLTGYGAAGTTFAASMKDDQGNNFDLGSSGTYKAGAKVGYLMTPHTEIFTSLDYDYFRYGVSPWVNGNDGYRYQEPNSHTEETAWRVGMAYHFR